MSQAEVSPAYHEYLLRFEAAVGLVDVGGFGKHNGQLVQKMTNNEFAAKQSEYETLYGTYEGAMLRGDTINDIVVRLLRECAAKLMLKTPVEI